MNSTTVSFYHTGGTLRPDAPSYVERKADQELYAGLMAGEYSYVLTSRQMGKSSLMNRTAARLREAGVAVAVLDLTAIGQNMTAEQWYDGLLGRLGRSLDLEEEVEEYWLARERLSPLQRWMGALHEVVLARCPGKIVIFIDEIDAVRSLPFSTDEFFAAIRECYNRRSEAPEFARLCFCLVGVASPSDLIQDTRTTPFNIGRRIELTDFNPEEAAPLAQGLCRDDRTGRALLERVLYWTGGHPYLTQRLCRAVAEDGSVTGAAAVDQLCEGLFLSVDAQERDDNLLFVRERLLRSELERASLLDLYRQVRRGRRVANDPGSEWVGLLRLAGIVRVQEGRLQVRNEIYRRVFDPRWIVTNMPDAELRRQRTAYWRGLLLAAAVFGVMLALMGGLAFTAMKQTRLERLRNLAARLAQEEKRLRYRYIYATQMNLAQQALEAANPPRALALLNEWRPQPGQEDLRGFEWRYFWRFARQDDARFTLSANEDAVSSVAFSPDGRLLATGIFGNTAKLWDTATHRQVGLLQPHRGGVRSLAFTPDGKFLVTGGRYGSGDRELGEVELWDVAARRAVAVLPDPEPGLNSVVLSPDGNTLAVVNEAAVKLWNIPTRRLHSTLKPYKDGCGCAAFSPDGRTLAIGGYDTRVGLWDVKTGRQMATWPGHGGFVASIAFSPNGKLLAVGSWLDGTVRLWDVAARRAMTALVTRGNNVAVAFSPDGARLAVANGTDIAQLWSTASWEQLGTIRGHQGPVICLAFAPGGRTLATGSADRTVKLGSTLPAGEDLFRAHSSKVQSLAISADGQMLVTGGVDHTIKLWSLPARKLVAVLRGDPDNIHYVGISPDGRTVASASEAGGAKLWDLATRRAVLTVPLRLPVRGVGSNHQGAFSPDSKIFALGTGDGMISLWDVTARRKLTAFQAHREFVSTVSFSPDGRTLGTGSHDLAIKLWDIDAWRRAGMPQVWHWTPVTFGGNKFWAGGPVFSPDGRTLANVSGDSTVNVWDRATQRKLMTLKVHLSQISWLGFCPDGRTLVTSSTDQTTKLWSTGSWTEAGTLKDPRQSSWAVAFTPDGQTLAMGREDGMVHFWRADSLARADEQANDDEARTLRLVASGGERKVRLEWQPLAHAVGYNLYRGPAAARSAQLRRLCAVPASQTSFIDQGLGVQNGRALSYAVAPFFPAARGDSKEGTRTAIQATPLALPAGWMGTSLNEGSHPGAAQFSPGNHQITVRGSGEDLWGDADGGYFASQAIPGDFQASVKLLAPPDATDEWAKAGLMLRDSLDPGGRDAYLVATPAHGLCYQGRLEIGGSARDFSQPVISHVVLKRPITLRLMRQGNTIRADYSEDNGRSFRPAGDPIQFDPPLPAAVYVGLAITSHDPNKISEARFQAIDIRQR